LLHPENMVTTKDKSNGSSQKVVFFLFILSDNTGKMYMQITNFYTQFIFVVCKGTILFANNIY